MSRFEFSFSATEQGCIFPFGKRSESMRHVILLQGPSSFFFRDLGRALRKEGALVTRIGFAPGDRLYWSRESGRYVSYNSPACYFGEWFTSFCETERPTDIVMLGDGRMYHEMVCSVVRKSKLAVRLHIIEHGYLRPGLISVDPHGMGRRSRIRESFESCESKIPQGGADFPVCKGAGFLAYASLDMLYHSANLLTGWFRYPHYLRPSLFHPSVEYSGWVGKAVTRPIRRIGSRAAIDQVMTSGETFFLVPLQLDTDFQIRKHGGGRSQFCRVSEILRSFAVYAPPEAKLLFKRHPLDNGIVLWRRRIAREADRLGLAGRVHYADHGDFAVLAKKAAGVITVNSTAGLQAMELGTPCVALGSAIYDIPGLTHGGGLDAFWTNPVPPDPRRLSKFRKFLLHCYHVPGSFDGPGARVGAAALARRICSEERLAH